MTEEIPKKIVQPLDIKDEARPHSLTGGDIDWPQPHPFPPAAESLAACIELGLIRKSDTSPTGVESTAPGIRMQWAGIGVCEIKQLVGAVWPNMPATGFDFADVVKRAKLGAALLCAAEGYRRYLRLNRSLPLDQSQRLHKMTLPLINSYFHT